MEEKSPLEELNDDCLDYLFQFLEWEDVIRLNLVSHRLQEISQRWMTKQEIPDFSELLRLRHMKPHHFFAVFGNFIKRVRIDIADEYSGQLNLLPDYCKNIEHIDLDLRYLRDNIDLLSFFDRMQSVRSLFIVSGFVDDRVIEKIIKLENLECLQIFKKSITGYRLNELKNLKQLEIPACDAVTTEHFINAFRANRNLTRINICRCPLIGPEAYRCIAEESRPLELLEFDADTLLNGQFTRGLDHVKHLNINNVKDWQFGESILMEYSNAAGETLTSLTLCYWDRLSFPERLLFPNLIVLNVYNTYLIDHIDIVLRRVCRSCPHLEKVKIFCWDGHVTQNALLDFIRQMESLVYVCLPMWECFNISLYKQIVEIRKKIYNPRTLKLEIWKYERFAKYAEISSFTRGSDYAGLRKIVEIKFY